MRRSLTLRNWSVAATVFALLVPAVFAEEEDTIIGFQTDAWTITAGQVVEHLGREALAGSARLNDVEFTDGVIEVDIAMDGRRCFPGIVFRAESEADTEVFYLRPHRSVNYSHALQYTPRFRGLTGWQLYSGPGFTATAEIPLDQWVHLKIEVLGTRARVFFDDMESPALVIDDLKRGSSSGFIGVTGPPDGRVHYSNFSATSGDDLDFGPKPIRVTSKGDLAGWEISSPIAPQEINRDISPGAQEFDDISWQSVQADTSGLIDVARFLDQPPRLPQCLIARTTISSEQAERRKLVFGYSDEISIFLNGDLLFRGDSTFRVRDTEFMGIIGLNDTVVIDLAEGENELFFVLTESFGGWGFMARTEGLRSDPIFLADGVKKAWEIAEGVKMPESAAWDAKRSIFYVSNINPPGAGGGPEAGFISRIEPTGKVLEMEWVSGLRSPTGIAVLEDRLYVVERTGVAIIDLDKGEIVERRPIESAGGFLNDLAIKDHETLFVSDSGLGAINRATATESELWLQNATVAGVNGLVAHEDLLWATTMGSESLVSIHPGSGEIESIIDLRPFGGDGITPDGTGAFLVSDFNGLLLRVTPDGDRRVLVDTRDVGISLTDFGFSPEHSIVVIPTLRGNSLIAYDIGKALGAFAE